MREGLTAPELRSWAAPGGSEELLLALERGEKARIIVLPAWFDEANKTRHFAVELMRRLHANGWAAFLPDLPGCNESVASLADQDLDDWRSAASEAARQCGATHCLTIRAGAVLAPPAIPGWRYAPIGGNAVLRALMRARIIAAKEAGSVENSEELLTRGQGEGLDLAGYRLSAKMVFHLAYADLPDATKLVDIAQRDVGGGGLWLRAEPDFDAAQADRLAELIGAPQ